MIITEVEWNRAAAVHAAGNIEADPASLLSGEPPSYKDSVSPYTPPSPNNAGHAGESSTSSGARRESPRPTPSPSTSHSRAENDVARDHRHTAARTAIKYTFVQESYNSMLLMYPEARLPLYHISTYMNCFNPSSQITVVRKGDSRHGPLVGQFEMGVSVKKSTIIIDGKEKLTDAVLTKARGRHDRNWQWRWHNDEKYHLSWTYDGPVRYCSLKKLESMSSEPPILASYTPPPLTPRADCKPSPEPSLKVFPEGQAFFDHILISALIIERKRLTPISSHPIMSWST